MKIIKQGSLEQLKRIETFDCDFCGCIFEADNKEYKIGSQYNEEYLYISCPFCGRTVYKDKEY